MLHREIRNYRSLLGKVTHEYKLVKLTRVLLISKFILNLQNLSGIVKTVINHRQTKAGCAPLPDVDRESTVVTLLHQILEFVLL